jgi:molybdopterin-guanine dinucleotide biosynthesis protein B
MPPFDDFVVPVFGITGWKNSGKTRLTTGLVATLTARGFRVGAIKHAHHSFEIDHEGRDSFKMRQAGARQVAVVSQFRWALVRELEGEEEPTFEHILSHFAGYDLVLAEGYKQLRFPKIETRSAHQTTRQLLAAERDDIIAVASDDERDRGALPLFHPDDLEGIANFVLATLEIAG